MTRLLGFMVMGLGAILLGAAVFVLVLSGLSMGFAGLLLSGIGGFVLGWNAILQSKGLMD